MNQERFQQIDKLLDAVLDLPESERGEFLDRNCLGDDQLKLEVLSLLTAQTNSNKFLEKSAMGIAARNLVNEQSKSAQYQLLGRKISTYKIESLLGLGGMGEVYLAQDEKLRRNVALKILPAEYTTNDERVKRFQLEARAISALNHPNIVTIYDVGSFDGINFIATEYVEGKTLRELINHGLSLKEVLAIIIQSCEALSAAHSRGITHRDIKPENIIVRPDGYIKILDFGLAKLSGIELNTLKNFNQTEKGVIIGTPAYMSPEQVADEKVDHRTDLWSIGVVLYELLTGINPFKKENKQSTFQMILSGNPALASSINPEIPTELDQILMKALEKEADLSYQTASDLRADLKRIKRELDSNASLISISTVPKPAGNKFRNLIFVGAIIFSFFALALFGGLFLLYKNLSKEPVLATEWSNAKHFQLTFSKGLVGYPSLSPDGKLFVYASMGTEKRDIISQRIGGTNETNLTQSFKLNSSMPVFSPDGKHIAFRSDEQGGGVFLMEETGENVRRISDIGFHPSWSPDGKKLVVSDKAAALHTAHIIPNSSLWIIDVASGEIKPLETKGDAIMPSWSPNGNRIAFWRISDGKPGEIATVSIDGGEPVVIPNDNFFEWNPVWSPDGKYLYYASDRGGYMNFWRIAIDEKSGKVSGSPESVSTPSKYCRHLSFSRDGNQIAYIRYESKSNLQSIAFDEKTGKVMGEPNWITRGDREVTQPQLSPDGKEFVFRTTNRTQEDLAIISKDGNISRNLTEDIFADRSPHWSPDGKKIFFTSNRSGLNQIWSMNSDGSESKQITFAENFGATFPVFSPDGNQLAFNQIMGKSQFPVLLDLTKSWAGQTLRKLPQPPNLSGSYSVRDWSKDGKKILISFFEDDGDESGIGVFSFETNSYEKITDDGEYPVWLNDNRRFTFNKDNQIYLADTQTKKTTLLYSAPLYQIQQPSISPDNKLIFYRFLQIDSDVWLLDASQNQ